MSAELTKKYSAASSGRGLPAAGNGVPVPAGQQEGFHLLAGCLLLSQLQLSAAAVMACLGPAVCSRCGPVLGFPDMQTVVAMK